MLEGERLSIEEFENFVINGFVQAHRVYWGDRLLTLDKSAGFLDDPHFIWALNQIGGNHAYDQYKRGVTVAWRLHTLVWAAKHALHVPGDFVECGVFRGDFSWFVAEMTTFSQYEDRRFWLFDTFDGFPDEVSADYFDSPSFLDTANSVYRQPDVFEEAAAKFSGCPNAHIIKGPVPETLSCISASQIAYLHIDMNNVAAEIGALEVLWDRVSPGGIVVFDDYGWHFFRKQKEAEDAWLAERGHAVLELPTGQGLVIKRR